MSENEKQAERTAGTFAAATAVSVAADAAGAPATPTNLGGTITYDAEIHEGWDILGNANGGYVLAVAARAMADALGRPPLTVTAHYLRPVPAGPARIVVTPLRVGGRMATASASLLIGEELALQVLGTFGEQRPGGFSLSAEPPVEVESFDQCRAEEVSDVAVNVPSIFSQVDVRLRPSDARFRSGDKAGRPEFVGWFALLDDEPIDEVALLLAADVFPPTVFNLDLPVAWVPTLELTVHIRAKPAPGPLRVRIRSRFIQDGLLDEDVEMWDSTGTLVAMSRQLALMPRG